MFRFLFGFLLGAVAGAVYGSRHFREGDLQMQLADSQERLQSLLHEVRSVLDETRQELRQAWERARESAVDKAERVKTAAEVPPGEMAGVPGSTGAAGTAMGPTGGETRAA